MTTRANPNSSREAAWRHLFRHADEPHELRRNPIVARHFLPALNSSTTDSSERAVKAVAQAIRAAFASYENTAISEGRIEESRRRRVIFEGHILSREPVHAIVAKLHISRSQFYRERRAICEYVALALDRAEAPSPAASTVELRADAIAINVAKCLIDTCETDRALAVLEDLGRASENPSRRIEALCLQADALTEQFRLDAASRRIDVARHEFSRITAELSIDLADIAAARIELSSSLLAARQGRADDARISMRKALRALRARPWADPDVRELHVDSLLFASEYAEERGDLKAFRECIAASQSIFSTIPNQSQSQKARLLLMSAFLLSSDRDNGATRNECIQIATAALKLAEKSGSVGTAVSAAVYISGAYAFVLGNYDEAIRQARPIVGLLTRGRYPALAGPISSLADVYIGNHQYGDALNLLSVAWQSAKLDANSQARNRCLASEAFLGLKDYVRARATADAASKIAGRLKNKRLHAAALRFSALARHRIGETKAARDCIEEAIDLGASGPVASTTLTYLASSIITGNSEHAKLARSLDPKLATFWGS